MVQTDKDRHNYLLNAALSFFHNYTFYTGIFERQKRKKIRLNSYNIIIMVSIESHWWT